MMNRFRMLLLFAWLSVLTLPAVAQVRAAPVPADLHDHLRQILHRPLYQRWQLRQENSQDSAIESTASAELQKFVDWLDSLISSWLRHSRLGHGHWTSPTLSSSLKALFWIIAIIALLLFAAAVVVLVVRLIRDNRNTGTTGNLLSREQVATALAEGDALALGGDAWLDEAGRLAAEKNFRAMYRALYLALLSGLHANGKIDFNRHSTNWTYVSRYRGQPAEREIFSSLTDLFDCVWYGLQESGHPDLAHLKREVQQLIQSTNRTGDPRAI